ncbi:metallophosphoesterase [Helicobacter mehlei]|uniref:UDP-2,3-diacylglucosamine hydrolase n=1 Tax=Helicobacter mehlei TaxID=2316080 RepID=A0A553V0I7_9HELI|nr:metallophosphoesterase [Helicobacter mehlei]TSA85977.1 UDP-2,3-diacylglucosamine hydrolase [Helicobacter mehlei]
METLAEGAIFVADAHHQEGSPHLPCLLDGLIANPPPQFFLMGDIFQILMGSVRSSYEPHALILEQLRVLSQKSTLFYLEGNHDMGLRYWQGLAQHAQIYPRNCQPLAFSYQDKTYLLAHGDLFLGWGYELYIRLLSNRLSCKILGFLDRIRQLYPYIARPIKKKKIREWHLSPADWICFKQERLKHYHKGVCGKEGVIEGHFHIQNAPQDSLYCPLPAFYCTKQIATFTPKGLVISTIP